METKKRKTWKHRLTKKEIKHLREVGVTTKASFQRTINFQAKKRTENKNNPILEPCWDCRFIAKKLGMEASI